MEDIRIAPVCTLHVIQKRNGGVRAVAAGFTIDYFIAGESF